MFDIEYKGGNGVVITTKKATLTIDPKLSAVGLKDHKTKDQIELATEARFVVENSDARIIVNGPGEYEVADFAIRGIAAQRHLDTENDEKMSTIYRIECGDVRICVLGNVDFKLTDDQQEAIGVIDILIIPVGGGGHTLDATSAAGIIRQLEPKVVVPIHYADAGLRYEVPQDTLETFTNELGAPIESVGNKYKVKSAAGLPQSLTVVEIARS